MIFDSYQQLIDHIQTFTTSQERLNAIIQYFMDNVEFDYVMIEHINQIVTPRFASYVDRLFPNINEKFRYKAINYIRNSSNISNEYWNRIKNIYLTPTTRNNNTEYCTMVNALNKIYPEVIVYNDLLKKGIASDISKFAKRLCDDCGINCMIIKGVSSGKMQHSWLNIEINGVELFYDITFAIYARDNFCGMARYKSKDWLGVTPKTLYKNQPTRTILDPKGFNLEYLGLNNLPLKMRNLNTAT